MIKRILIVFMMLAGILASHGGMVEADAVRIAAKNWIGGNAVFRMEPVKRSVGTVKRLHDANGHELPLWQVDLQPSGYLVMSGDDTLPSVVAFDTTGKLDQSERKTLNLMLETQGAIYERVLSSEKTRGGDLSETNRAEWSELLGKTRADSGMSSTVVVNPLLTTEWNQRHPYDYFSPVVKSHCVKAQAGCVMVAMGQIMKYYEWPVASNWLFSWNDSEGKVKASMQADWSFPYDWSLLSDTYGTGGLKTTLQEIAIGRLCADLGVLKQADYEPENTGAWDYDIGNIMTDYLGYSPGSQFSQWYYWDSNYGTQLSREWVEWLLKADIKAMKPVIVGYIDKARSGAHCFVADGLAEYNGRDYYHLNYGWGGQANGWYLFTNGYEESVIYGCLTGITPPSVPVFKEMAKEQPLTFTLAWHFPKNIAVETFRLLRKDALDNVSVVDSQISGNARSYIVSEKQAGIYYYVLQAYANGSWQDLSKVVTVTVKENPMEALTLTAPVEIKNFNDSEVSFEITANHEIAEVSVFCHRPELLTGEIAVSGDGASRTISMQPKSGAVGNLLVEITAVDAVGSIARKMMSVSFMTTQWMSEINGGGNAVGVEESSWMTGLDAKWTVQKNTFHSAPSALQSGTLRRGVTQRSELNTCVSGPVRFIFQWKLKAEEKSGDVLGALDFYIDGKKFDRIRGDTDWCRRSFPLNGGEHFIDWICVNFEQAKTVAKGWVDDVQWFTIQREGEYEYYIKDGEAYISMHVSNTKNLIVPDTLGGYPVVGIDDYSFSGNMKLKSVEFPETVSFIGNMVFDGCVALEKILLKGPPCEFGEESIPETASLYVRETQGWHEDTLGNEYPVVLQYPVNVNGSIFCYAEEGAAVSVKDVRLPEIWKFVKWTCEEFDVNDEMALDRNMAFSMPNSTVSLMSVVGYDLLLRPGWNLITLQLNPLAETERRLADYHPMTVASKSYCVANKLVAGEGYWVFNRRNNVVSVDVVGDMLTTKPPIVKRRWQLIGIVSDVTLGEFRQGMVLHVWQWSGGGFRLVQDDAQVLKGGQAYWMFAE